jgi:hypothetical protein
MNHPVFVLRRRFANVFWRTETSFSCQSSVKTLFRMQARQLCTHPAIYNLQSLGVGTVTRLCGRVRGITIPSTEGAIDFSLLQSIKIFSGAHTASCMVGTEDTSCGKNCTIVNLTNRPSSAEIIECIELCPHPSASLYGSHIENFTFRLDDKDSVVSTANRYGLGD